KTSTARVRLVPGTGRILINKRDAEEYFPYETQRLILNQPLVATETDGTYDFLVNVDVGGLTDQAGAILHGIVRALLQADSEYPSARKSEGLLTRDTSMKERYKYGLNSARRAPQFSKR